MRCRPCGSPVTIPRREYQALTLAARKAANLEGRLRDALDKIRRLEAEAGAMRSAARSAPPTGAAHDQADQIATTSSTSTPGAATSSAARVVEPWRS